jgi:cytochrome c1
MMTERGLTALLFAGVLLAAGCRGDLKSEAALMTGGDPDRGNRAIQTYGCGGCHSIPGVRGASGLVGPPLDNIASRAYLGGHLPNTPQNMMRWIRFPQEVDPRNAMPDMRVSDRDARDMAAYLYMLR